MCGQLLNTVTVLVLVASAAGCTRLPPERQPGMRGSLPVESLDDSLTIPAEWGTLAAVDHDPSDRAHTRLWFEDEEGTIRLVAYNRHGSRLQTRVAVMAPAARASAKARHA